MTPIKNAHAKGSKFEREVVAVLRAAGHRYAERGYRLGAPDDRGDIDGIPGFVFECRNRQRIELAGWLDEIRTEAAALDALTESAGTRRLPVLVVKRRGHGAERAYAVLELETFARLIADDGAL